MGIVGCPLLVADEPGSWEVNGGTLMADAITTALGKPDSPMKVIYIGTLAPATSGWWHDLIADGSHGSTYVQALRRLQGRENHIDRTGMDLARAEQDWNTNRGHSQLRQRYGISYRQHFRDARDRAVRDFEEVLPYVTMRNRFMTRRLQRAKRRGMMPVKGGARLAKHLRDQDRPPEVRAVAVGVIGGRYEDGVTIAQVAFSNEYGTRTYPSPPVYEAGHFRSRGPGTAIASPTF